MRIHTIILFFSLFYFSPGYSQKYYFNHYKVDQGLSNNSIRCAVQDEDKFLWFGTKNGLNRFDGNNFKIYQSDLTNPDEIGSNFIRNLLIDKNRTIWVGTDQGIYLFDKEKEQFNTFNHDITGEVLAIEKDKNDEIWFIANLKLYHYSPVSKKITQLTSPKDFLVYALTIDKDGNTWYANHKGILTCVQDKRSINLNQAIGTKDMWVQKLYTDQEGYLLIGTRGSGLLRVSPKDLSVDCLLMKDIEGNPIFVRDILHLNHNYWLATESGVFIYDTNTSSVRHLYHENDNPWSLSDNAIYTLCADHEGGVWIGAYFGGINYYHPQMDLFEKIFPRYQKHALTGNAVREIVEDAYNNIWIGTEDEGLNCWNPTLGTFDHYGTTEGLSHDNIHGLLLVGDTLCIGTFDRGLDLFDIRQRKIIGHYDSYNTDGKLGNNFVSHIRRTRGGTIYLATGRGLYTFDIHTETFSRVEEVPTYIFYTNIYEDSHGNIWLGTWRDGLVNYNPNTGETRRYMRNPNQPHSLNSNRVNYIYETRVGEIWVATENGIAILANNKADFRRLTTLDGLPSNQILALTEDDFNIVWISTSHGLVSYDTQKKSLKIYNKERGIIGLQFNYNSVFRDHNHFVYFGASGGMIRFNPAAIIKHPFPKQVPIYLTGLQVQHKEVSASTPNAILDTAIAYTRALRLSHDQSTFSIEFAAITFLSPQSKVYRYKLEGYDKDWITLKNSNTAYFTQVPAGKYTLRVQLAEIDGTPLSLERNLEITIRPSIWLSPSAYFVYGAAVLAMILYMIWSYDRRIEEKNRKRLEALKLHRERALYKAKIDFFTGITHDIKTPLTLIKAPLDKIISTVGADSPLMRLLETIQRNTNKLVLMTTQLLDFRKIESNGFKLYFTPMYINQVLKEIVEENRPLITYRQLTLSLQLGAPEPLLLDKETVSKIVSNLLDNAIKYSQQNIHISTELVPDNQVCITFKNDGNLIPKDEIAHLFKPFYRAKAHVGKVEGTGLGLSLARSLAELHGGTLTMRTEGRENIFVLKLPLLADSNKSYRPG